MNMSALAINATVASLTEPVDYLQDLGKIDERFYAVFTSVVRSNIHSRRAS